MNDDLKKRSRKAGLPPGTLVYIGDRATQPTTISAMDYNETSANEHHISTPEECRNFISSSTTTWININGLNDTAKLQQIGNTFGLHPLVLEDIVNTTQRPKMEDHGDYIFLIFRMLYRNPNDFEIVSEQVSMILGKNYIISFQEVEGDIFDTIRERIRAGKGRIRKHGPDYLSYALLDATVDHYFVIMESMSDRIEDLQEDVLTGTKTNTPHLLQQLRSDVISMRKTLWPLRELVSTLEKTDSKLIRKTTTPYFRDVYEHTIQVIDTVETMRDTLSGAMEIYLSTISNRMNEIMKVLTIISTIFIPLTFIAGVYGMNFRHMPELDWTFGYLMSWVIMAAVAIGMLIFFKRKKWL